LFRERERERERQVGGEADKGAVVEVDGCDKYTQETYTETDETNKYTGIDMEEESEQKREPIAQKTTHRHTIYSKAKTTKPPVSDDMA
jgi:hypothetical protein